MKQSFRHLLGSLLMLALPLLLTSCEGMFDDILGEWSRPGSKEAILSNLSSALEEGALVTITYTIDGVEYTSTFKRVGGKFIEQSPASTRALTRGVGSGYPKTRVYIVKNEENSEDIMRIDVDMNYKKQLDVSINVATAEMTTNYSNHKTTSLKNVIINTYKAKLKAKMTNIVDIMLVNNELLGEVYYYYGESWNDVTKVSQDNGGKYLQINSTTNQVVFTANSYSGYLVYKNGSTVGPSDIVGDEDDVYYLKEFPAVAYQERSWNATTHQVETSNRSVSAFNIVTSSETDVYWNKGTYVVNQDVTIKGAIACDDEIKLILCNGCTLKANRSIMQDDKIFVYGQDGETGKFSLLLDEIMWDQTPTFIIHGGIFETNSPDYSYNDLTLTMYGGKFIVNAEGMIPAINAAKGNSMNIYGGEVEVSCRGGNAIEVGDATTPGTLTMYGGKLTAKAPKKQALVGKFTAGAGCNIKYQVGEDAAGGGIQWGDYVNFTGTSPITIPNEKYFKAEKATP